MTVSAIPDHLLAERRNPKRKSDSFTPPYPSFSARFDPKVTKVVMAYFGIQHRSETEPAAATLAVKELLAAAVDADGPAYRDQARYIDEAGYRTTIHILYWLDDAQYERWKTSAPAWTDTAKYTPDVGFFTEILTPTTQRFETLFSNDRLEGISVASNGLSGEIQEHGYWGGARDRLPLAQIERLEPGAPAGTVTTGNRVTIAGRDNLCLIRSGQEWTETASEERRMYLEEVEPVLRTGMEFLRDDGLAIGCFANRYLRVCDDSGEVQDKSFGMSWWRSLEDLESWSESHPTHVAIFRVALKYLSTMGPAAKLRLYHEISVVEAGQQQFDYLGCHPKTGMLRSLA